MVNKTLVGSVDAAAGIRPSPSMYWCLPHAFAILHQMDFVIRLGRWVFESLLRVPLDHTSHASMWEDLHMNRPTEIDYLNGAGPEMD